jgi:KDO2-lipid IV(A) lauroyltransferase
VTAPEATSRWHPRGLNNSLIVSATYKGVSTLPTWLTYRIGHVGTWLACRLQGRGRRALVENFRVIFPGETERRLNALALLTYRSYGRDVIDFMRSLSMTPEATRRMVSRLDARALEQAVGEGRGAIAVSGHFGNWELGGVLLGRLTTYALSVVVKAEASPGVGRLRQQLRESVGIETLEVRQHLEMALRIRACLQQNRVVALLVDRHLGKDYVPVQFFGRTALFLRTPALLGALSGAPLVPCFVYRDEQGRFAVECGPLIRVPTTGDRDVDAREATQAVATVMEGYIRRFPHCWYQFYPFWSTQPESVSAAPTSHAAASR